MAYVETDVSIERLRDDFPFYAEACLRIKTKAAGEVQPLVLNHSQRAVQAAIDRCRREGRPARIIELKARQTGLSTDAEARLFHRCHLRKNRTALIVAHVKESATKIFDMARTFYDNMPPELPLPKKYFTKNLIQFQASNSSIQVGVANKMGGRGFTAQYIHYSEFAFYENPSEVLAASMNSVPNTVDSLVIIESTPQGHNDFHDMWIEAKRGKSDFIPIFIPWFHEPGYRMRVPAQGLGVLDDFEKELVRKYGVDERQIQWRRWAIANNCKGDPELFLQEYPSDDRSCFLASGRPAFDRESLEYYAAQIPPERPEDLPPIPDPAEIVIDNEKQTTEIVVTPRGRCRQHRKAVARSLYEMGVDLAEGVPGGDRSAFTILNRYTMDFEFVWAGYAPPEQVAVYCNAVGRLYNDAECIPEFNNHGYAFMQKMEELDYPAMWMRPQSFETAAKRLSERRGFQTNVKTRHYLIDSFREYVRRRMGRIEDPELIGEMLTFIYDGDKAIAQAGKKDDVVIAAALSVFGHRGRHDAPLEPLSLEVHSRVMEQYGWKVDRGEALSSEELAEFDLTADELEELDERARERDHALRGSRLSGRMT